MKKKLGQERHYTWFKGLVLASSLLVGFPASDVGATVLDRTDETALIRSAATATSLASGLTFHRPSHTEHSGAWSILKPSRANQWSLLQNRSASPGPREELDTITTSSIRAGMFGSVAIRFGGLSAAQRWKPIYAAISTAKPQVDCSGNPACTARKQALELTIEKARGQGFVKRLETINRFVNQSIRYGSDREVYGQTDHWAMPSQTLLVGRGDCEDYAILKMAALKAAGIPTNSMSLVVLRDRKRSLFHAVLAVTTDRGHYILDNANDRVLLDTDISRYQPLYSLSQDRSWIHGYRREGGSQVAVDYSLDQVAPGEGVAALYGQ